VTSSQAPEQAPQDSCTSTTTIRSRGNIPHPFGLTNPEHIARYNALSSKLVVATQYYDEDVLNHLGWFLMIFVGCLRTEGWADF